MKKIFIILLAVTMLFAGIVPVCAEEDYLNVILDKERMKNDEALAISVSANDASPIGGMQFVMSYDFGKFTVESVEQGEAVQDALVVKIDYNDSGKVKAAFVYDGAYAPEGSICTINLRARSSTGLGDAYFSFSEIEVTDEEGNLVEKSTQKCSVNIYSDDVTEETPLPTQPPAATAAPKATSTPAATESTDVTPSPTDSPTHGSSGTGSGTHSGTTQSSATAAPTSNPDSTQVPGSTQTPKSSEMPFEDVIGHWAYDDIAYLYARGIINGMSDTEFMPEKQVTRAEFVKMISGIADLPQGEEISFLDVTADDWFFEAVSRASAAGLVNGYGDEFKPQNNITREEMAVIADRCASYMGIDTQSDTVVTFADENILADWSRESVLRMAAIGILNGMDDGFCPSLGATRAQAAAVIKRIYTKENPN